MRFPALLLCIALAVPAHAAPTFTALVTAVADGVTLTVLTAQDKRQVKIRLYGIDCPESRQTFGKRAKQASSDAVFGKNVTVQPINTEHHGLTAAVVLMPGGKSLNEHLIREGLAQVSAQHCTQEDICAPLSRLEKSAKLQKRGMWEDKKAVQQQDDWLILPRMGGGGREKL